MKALVLFSGGSDSTICLAIAVKKYGSENVTAISIDYGQNNSKELEHSKIICNKYNVNHEVIDLQNVFKYCSSSLVKKSENDIPYESYDEQASKLKEGEDVSTNVSFRNGVMLSVCASYAISNKAEVIYYGIHTEEGVARRLYPDCDEDFNMAMNLAIYIGSGKKVKIEAPLSGLLKKDVIKLGNELNVPFEDTWTCYENREKPCGKCTACTDRIKAFRQNNLIDPLEYERN